MSKQRSPGMKLLLAGVAAALLVIPLMLVYMLVYDRENQSEQAQSQITQGWGGPQTVTGPVLVIPFMQEVTRTETVDGKTQTKTSRERRELFLSPSTQALETDIQSDRKGYAIYESVVYSTALKGSAQFDLPEDLKRLGIEEGALLPGQSQLRFGISDPRGLTGDAKVRAGGESLTLEPGNGPAATGGSGFSANLTWDGSQPLDVSWDYAIRGSRSLALVPRGGLTRWEVTSPWPHPSFTGSFLPDDREIGADGFTASYAGITNLALGRPLAALVDDGPPALTGDYIEPMRTSETGGPSMSAMIALVDPVDLYSQVDRAVKYGFLFIGFTFATFLMFDIVGGARVATAEYLLTGAGLVLFFVLLLAFAEIIGFSVAYVLAAAAIIGLLTAYSAAVLGTWRRAGFIGAMLGGLYALLFVLLNLETYSLVIGSVLLFAALAGIMYATRRVDWGAVGPDAVEEGARYA